MIKETDIIKFCRYDISGGIHPETFKSISNSSLSSYLTPSDEQLYTLPSSSNVAIEMLVMHQQPVLAGQKLISVEIEKFESNIHSAYDGIFHYTSRESLSYSTFERPPSIKITNSNANTIINAQTSTLLEIKDWTKEDQATLIARIHEAGIVGLGGAAFPTHIKIKKAGSDVKTLIVNAMECEPYITCDDRLLRESSFEILQGALITANIIKANSILFGIEDNKPEAIKSLEAAIEKYQQEKVDCLEIKIMVAKTKYPSGGEKQIIQLLTGLEVPQGKYPANIGILVQNVATLYAIHQAICLGKTLTHRLVTITGDLVKSPANYWIAFGTPIAHIYETLAIAKKNISSVIFGGPLMGQVVLDQKKNTEHELNIATRKSTNCIMFNSKNKLQVSEEYQACIRCGECEKVCPASLVPQQLFWFSQSEQWEQLEQQNLFDCIECGACSYVCPSTIPLVNFYRFAKSEIKHLKRKQRKSEIAKQRFDNREDRLARIKAEREEKRRKTADARKLAASNKSKDPDGKASAIEAALKRVKDKKEKQP